MDLILKLNFFLYVNKTFRTSFLMGHPLLMSLGIFFSKTGDCVPDEIEDTQWDLSQEVKAQNIPVLS